MEDAQKRSKLQNRPSKLFKSSLGNKLILLLPVVWTSQYIRRDPKNNTDKTAFSPESAAGSSEAKFNGSPFCVSRERRRS